MNMAIDLKELRPLDPGAPLPLYVQLAERLSVLIRPVQERLAGRMLPSEAELTAHFSISRPTVRQAMGRLLSEGLIVRGRGRGTFVAPRHASRDLGGPSEFELLPPSDEIEFRLIARLRLRPTPPLRALFALRSGEPVERITRLRLIQGEVYAFEERFLPVPIAEQITDAVLSRDAGLVFIRRFIGGKSGKVDFRFRAIPASADQARILDTKRGAPLLSSEHTYYGIDERPILHGIIVFRGDRYDFGFSAPVHGCPERQQPED